MKISRIDTDEQLKVAKEKLEDLKIALKTPPNPDVDPILIKTSQVQIESIVEDLEKEISKYEKRKSKIVTKVICLYGGPSTGKTTTSLEISHILKVNHVNCELVREYVKDWVWEGRKINPYDQVYLLAKQSRREQILYGTVDVIVTDAPLWLFPIYEKEMGNAPYICQQIVDKFEEEAAERGVEFIHVFLNRIHPYNPKGRYQSESDAIKIDMLLKKYLEDNNIPHYSFDSVEGVGKDIVNKFNLLESVKKL